MRGGDGPTVEDQEWGETFPAFRTGRSVVSPSNELWVLRWLPVDEQPIMDVFGPDGVKKGSVSIPERSQLLGFGTGGGGREVAYFIRTDCLHRLSDQPWDPRQFELNDLSRFLW